MINAKNVCYTSIYSGVLSVMIDGHGSRFHYDVISCELARQGVRRDAAEANGSGEVQSVWAW